MPRRLRIAAATILLTVSAGAAAEEIGSVDTAWKLLGPDHKVVIEAFDDPDIPGAACWISRARTGGLKGWIGVAEDTADAAIACRQTGPITLPMREKDGRKQIDIRKIHDQEVFSERRSLIFKELHVRRFYDSKRNTLVYLTYSDRLIEGSPKNSISVVPIRPWP